MDQEKIPKSIGVHCGTFHADEVTACALLICHGLVDRHKVYRSRDESVLEQCEYVCDVGGVYDPQKKLFDHHQAEYRGDLSSAGMILLYLKENNVLSSEEYDFFNDHFVHGVDAIDNGKVTPVKGFASFSLVISSFVPVDHNAGLQEEDACFFEALDFACAFVERLKKKYAYHLLCLEQVKTVMEKFKGKECLFFEKSLNWLESFFQLGGEEHSARFIIMPSGEHWKLRGIPPSLEDRMSVRRPLPSNWAGLLGEELQKASGISGGIFCHKGRFISVWESKKDALDALDIILEEEKKGTLR